jgi:hypothetical protein
VGDEIYYNIHASDCINGVYGQSGDLTGIVPVAGETVEVEDIHLAVLGTIAGTLTDALSGDPIVGICVEGFSTGTGIEGDAADTAVDGTFGLRVEPGRFVLRVNATRDVCSLHTDEYPAEYLGGTTDREEATELIVSSGGTVPVDWQLVPNGILRGVITDEKTGAALDGFCIDSEATALIGSVLADAHGGYEMFLPPGTQELRFSNCFGNAVNPPYTVTSPLMVARQVTEFDVVVPSGSEIWGRVTDEETGVGIEGIHVKGAMVDEFVSQIVFTNQEGDYFLRGLLEGEATLSFSDPGGTYIPEGWNDPLTGADTIMLAFGPPLIGIDAALTRGGGIGGRMVAPPHDRGCVGFYSLEGDLVATHYLPGDGPSYARWHLKPGQYLVKFFGCESPTLSTWYPGVLSPELAEPVTVIAGEWTWNINGRGYPRFEFFDDTSIGFVTPRSLWHLLDGDGEAASFYYGIPGDLPVLGDWDCDGTQTPGMFRPSSAFAYLTNSRTTTFADEEFFFGLAGDIPLAGDWNGDGCDTLGAYRPTSGQVFLRNSLDTGVADIEYFFGVPGDMPFVGDFDGDGIDEVGLYRPGSGLTYLRLSHTTGVADVEFFYGNPGDRMIAGDWDGDGIETVAVFRPSDEALYLRNENSQGVADLLIEFGENPDFVPVS